MAVKPIPEGFNTVSAYLVVRDVEQALEFYQKAFGAERCMLMKSPDGKSVMHAEMRIGSSMVMLSQENLQWGQKSVETFGGSPVALHLYVEDVDKAFQRAQAAGCQEIAPLMDAFWGDRYGKLQDPFGLQWGLATHKEDVNEAECAKRAAAWFASMNC